MHRMPEMDGKEPGAMNMLSPRHRRSCLHYFDDEFTKDEQRICREDNNYYKSSQIFRSSNEKSFVDGQTDDLKETKTDDTISLKNKFRIDTD